MKGEKVNRAVSRSWPTIARGRTTVACLALALVLVPAWTALAGASPVHAGVPTASGARATHTRGSGLRVVVAKLPGGARAAIRITGPHGVRREVSHSGLVRLAPGSYLVSATAVSTGAGTYYPAVPRERTLVRSGRVTAVRVSYATLISNRTHVVPASGTVSLVGEPTGQRVLTLSGAAAASASPGQYLASGPSSAAPEGYLVKVISVQRNGETAALEVENATLLQAVPSGEINTEETLEAPPGNLQAPSSALRFGRYRSGAPAAHAAGFSFSGLKCTSSARLEIGYERSFTPTIALHAKWSIFGGLQSASVTATVTETMGISAYGDAGVKCATDKPIPLLAHPIPLPTIDVQVGFVPIVITPQLQLYFSGSASVTAKISASLQQQASATLGAEYDHGSFRPIASFRQGFTPSLTAEGNASAEVALTPTVETRVDGIEGPTFDMAAIAKADANTNKTPWWTLQGCLEAGVAFKFSLLRIDWEDTHLIHLCRTLLSAKTPPPGGSPSAGSGEGAGSGKGGGGGGGSPGGDGEKGELCKKYETIGFETKCVQK